MKFSKNPLQHEFLKGIFIGLLIGILLMIFIKNII